MAANPNDSTRDGRHHPGIPGLGKDRLESLTDGIFGTIMTILVLSLSVPIITSPASISSENSQLSASLSGFIPDVLAYVISFTILGSFWVRHHLMFHLIARVDGAILWLNILFLLTIGFIPFSTALLGRYSLLEPALVVYGANFAAASITSQFLWIYAVRRKLLSVGSDLLDERRISSLNRRMTLGPVAYAVGIVLSFFYPILTLAIYVATLVFFVLNSGVLTFRIGRRIGKDETRKT